MTPRGYAPYQPLINRVQAEATVVGERIVRIDHFLNHRIEPAFMDALGAALAQQLAAYQPTLVLTAEASGIAPGLEVARHLHVPLVFAKKYAPVVEAPALSRLVPSATKGGEYRLVVAARYLQHGERVVIVDDFLANGRTAVALAEIAGEAGARVVGAGFIVEKYFQHGRAGLEARGVPVHALAIISRLHAGTVEFAEPDISYSEQ